MSFRTADEKSRPSRRTILLAGGAVLTGLAGTGIIATAMRDEEQPEKEYGTHVGEFDMARSKEFLAPTSLYNKTGPQSFAFDDENQFVYTLQLIQGGIELPDERGALTTGSRREYGDMCVTRLDFDGKIRGHMYLRGFGHGISLGVEPTDGRTHLWVEGDAAGGKSGYGRTVTRVPFRDGSVLDSSDPDVRHQEPLPGALATHPALDLETRRVLVSFREGTERRYAIYPMDRFRKGAHGALHELPDVWQRDGESFQGCALYGDYIYQLTGSPYTDDEGENPPSDGGNTYVSAIDVQTGKRAGRQLVTAAPDLDFREPEGIAVSMAGGRPRLCVGFSVKSGDRRKLTVYRFTQ
ncbi:phage baseplate protein [Streptomyces sp. NBC_00239]|uniref:phage baseplate protein n=1 Tax=Streptomyces sp. NBC_00239 TaxID=2903640 RepID=UPI002E2C1B87|nr:signaling protein [Streptomyces sp. NBC_00239]